MSESNSQVEKAAYEEAGQNYRKFLDWREKIVGGYVAILGGLGLAFHANGANYGFQSILLCAAILTSAAFWVLNNRNSEFIRTCVAAGKKHEPIDSGVYNALSALEGTTQITHGFAVNLLVSGVIVVSAFKLWIDRVCWWRHEYLWPLITSFACFALLVILLECRGRGKEKEKG